VFLPNFREKSPEIRTLLDICVKNDGIFLKLRFCQHPIVTANAEKRLKCQRFSGKAPPEMVKCIFEN